MSDYLTDALVERAAAAEWGIERHARSFDQAPDDLREHYTRCARAGLEAVLPDLIDQIKAGALLEEVTDDAAMDVWWEASDDGWAVPPYLPARFLRHWLRRGES